jgi:hypothetical protein
MPIASHAFVGRRLLCSGPLVEVAVAVRSAIPSEPILVFDDATGKVIDLDLSGTEEEVSARYFDDKDDEDDEEPAEARGRGRPKLGVVGREVTLLPRHWEWLTAQPGGASVALRKLVDAARKQSEQADRARVARDRAYLFMHAIGGDLPEFEAASRALFAGDRGALTASLALWPDDVADYVEALLVET